MNINPSASFRYTPCSDLYCITTYFNPAHYRTRRANYELFAAPIRAAGISLLTVECALGGDAFDLPPGPDVLQARGADILWQKERLVNLGVANLPLQARKVAWLDGDILFTNPDWAVECAKKLDECHVLQPFQRGIRLKRGEGNVVGGESAVPSFASAIALEPELLNSGEYDLHGHTGFAWAARRGWLGEYGLYEAFLSGNGDHYIAHALAGDLTSPCMHYLKNISRLSSLNKGKAGHALREMWRRILPARWRRSISNMPGVRQGIPAFWQHFEQWARQVSTMGTQIGWIPGEVLHLWHGDGVADRGHGKGWLAMHQAGYDPAVDIGIGSGGCLEWATDKPALRDWAQQFFYQRREDG